MTEQKKCGCGRSPTGRCCGWHNLTEEAYLREKELYEYKKQAQELWFDGGSCTGGQPE
jgi:hypothetical protein